MTHLGMNTREDIVKNLSMIASDAKIDVVVCSPGDISSINTFKNNGKVPNSITLLPEWYNPAGHINNGL